MTDCRFCHKSLTNNNAYDFNIYTTLINWLNKVTCITWYIYALDHKRPVTNNDEQYGMVFIPSHEPMKDIDQKRHSFLEDGEIKNCISITRTINSTAQLFVFRESGDKFREGQIPDYVDGAQRSGADILNQINDVLELNEYTSGSDRVGFNIGIDSNNSVTISGTDNIAIDQDKIKSIYEWFAVADFPIQYCRKTSYSIDDYLTYCVVDCNDIPMCSEPECKHEV